MCAKQFIGLCFPPCPRVQFSLSYGILLFMLSPLQSEFRKNEEACRTRKMKQETWMRFHGDRVCKMVFWTSQKTRFFWRRCILHNCAKSAMYFLSSRLSRAKCPCRRRRHSENGRLETRKHLNLMGLSCHFFSHQPSNVDVLQVHIICV